ncbi:MAG: response regulator [Bryobacterales bacterium]|nr:response regulator [Bryobacteraceae bacterium]MDW8130963.1 response regulator [Bryobacterales bacterium]
MPDIRDSQAANPLRPQTSDREAILLVSPLPEDHALLLPLLSATGRKTYAARTYREAMTVLCRDRIAVVLCECELPDGKWKDLLSQVAPLSDPPCLIVTSRVADEYLWAEVLNLGGYDVLAKPFDPREVSRVVALACEHWARQRRAALAGSAWPKPEARAGSPPPQAFKTSAGH